jgi:hypothetical protein
MPPDLHWSGQPATCALNIERVNEAVDVSDKVPAFGAGQTCFAQRFGASQIPRKALRNLLCWKIT